MASEFPKWRDELPTEPGWYWMDDARWESDHLIVACLRMHHGRLCLFSPSTFEYWPLANYDKCRWSGPLTPPPNEPAVVSMWQVVLRRRSDRMPASAWTRRLPTKPGFYWLLHHDYVSESDKYAHVVQVLMSVGELVVEFSGMEGDSPLSQYESDWWSGPLPCPPFPAPPKKG